VIGWINPEGESFGGLISYIETGKGGRHPGRVAWREFYNLPTCKPRVAACYMAATGRSSISCTRTPVYHFSVSFAPDDPVDEAMMRRVTERTLRDMGLEEYECAVFAHRDRSHVHLHFVVCRVHPVRRTLWRNWRDRTRLEYSLRAQEVEFGLQVVPGWLAPVPAPVDRARDGLAQGQEPEARWLKPRPAPRRGDATFLQDVTERASSVLAQARSWAELERGLAEQGLSLRVKGGGFRITDGKHQVKASEVGRGFSRYHLEQRLGGYPDYRARMAVAGIAPARPSPTAVQSSASPEPAAGPTSPASAHAPPAETRVPVQSDVPSVELPKPPSPGRQKVNFLMEAKERAAPVLQRADSWEALERDLAAHGFSLQMKGGGFVVARGELEVKASEVGRACSRFYLEKRLGPYPHPRPRPDSAPVQPPVVELPATSISVQPPELPVKRAVEPAAPVPPPVQPVASPAPDVLPAATVEPDQAVPARQAGPPKATSPGRRKLDFLMEAKEWAGPVLERADSWEALERGLADRGLTLRPKAGGFVVARGKLEVKASDVGRGCSRFYLEARLGPYPHSPARPAPAPVQPSPPSVAPRTPSAPVRPPEQRVERPVEPAMPVRPAVQPVMPPRPISTGRRKVDFLIQAKERAGPVVRRADSWEALERGLADQGFSLRVKGGGFVVTDGVHEVKASDVDRAFSRKHLEDRLGRHPDSRVPTASTEPTSTAPGAIGQQDRPALAPAKPHGSAEAIDRPVESPSHVPSPAQPPVPANRAALSALPPEPLREAEPPRLADVHVVAQEKVWIGAALDVAAEPLRLVEAIDAAKAAEGDAREVLRDAWTASKALEAKKDRAKHTRAQLLERASYVYASRLMSVDALLEHAREDRTLAEAKNLLHTRPEHFGALEPDTTGWARWNPFPTFRTARAKAHELADLLDSAARASWNVPKPEEFVRATEGVRQANEALDAAIETREGFSKKLSRRSLIDQAARALNPLLSVLDREEIELRLGQKLASGGASLATQAIKAAITLAEGPRQERGGVEIDF